ncbi:MAG: glucose 1-dehydrogenase [Frankiales bacterium]|nr:glucose 1-dehydrogenase [Frankiales bacterium]
MTSTPSDLFDLSGKVALVTGGSRGLGRVMAEGFALAGAEVVVASRKAEACEVVAREISATTGRRALGVGCHVGRWEDLDALAARVYSEFGRVDVLVNNAGMSPLYDSLEDVTEALFDKVVDVNLKGPFRLAAVIGTRMASGAGGSIINISSAGAVHPRPGILPYAAAKAGLNAVTVGLAHAFGPTVRVNAIMVGTFMTDVSTSWDPDAFARRAEGFALRRGGRPEEILGTALYLASDASSYTTGSIVTVDGGQP